MPSPLVTPVMRLRGEGDTAPRALERSLAAASESLQRCEAASGEPTSSSNEPPPTCFLTT
jgi:hypothetical protein